MGGWIDPPPLTIPDQENKKRAGKKNGVLASTMLQRACHYSKGKEKSSSGFLAIIQIEDLRLPDSRSPRLLQGEPFCVAIALRFSSSLNGGC